MESSDAYIPMDRRQVMARGEGLPSHTHGAALFADISGFTPLTEALLQALGPRRGADELTRQLNRVYDTLISEVHRYRGSVITFSGDAIMCWFDNNPTSVSKRDLSVFPAQANLRAIACGLAMQQAMGQFASVETPTGETVSLAMKAAVAAGPVRRFRIGDPKIQYLDVLAGATLDRMVAAEHVAQKGEVVLSPEVVRQMGDKVAIAAWRPDVESGHRFAVVAGLTEAVEATPWSSLLLSQRATNRGLTEAQTRPWLLPPVYERLSAGQGQFLAEIRPAVSLFLRFGGLDYDQDKTVGEKLGAYIHWVQNILVHYEAYLLQLTIGDKGSYIYSAFGAPLAHDDDPARAVAAALELQALPDEFKFINKVQIGISQGRVRAGAYGGSARRTYGVLGDEVNIAARLMVQAEPGQISVSQNIAEAVASNYHLDFIGPVKVKGKQEAIPVSVVLGRRLPSPERPTTAFTTPLVGRDEELAQFAQVLKVVLDGKGQLLRVEGANGVGKSHLAAELVKQARSLGLWSVVGTCQSTSQGILYYSWRQIFRTLFKLSDEPSAEEEREVWLAQQINQIETIVSQTNPAWQLRLPLLGDLLDLPIPDNPTTAAFDSQLRQEALITMAVELLQTWAGSQPLLLLIEDAHWLDEASLELTLALSRAIRNMPFLLVLVHRPPTLSEKDKGLWPALNQLSYSHHFKLGELSTQGLATLVSNCLQGQPSALALSLIQAKAQGNPFYAEELLDVLRETDDLYRQADGRWTLSEAMFKALYEAHCLTKENGQWVLAEQAPLTAADLGLPDSIHGIVLSRIDRLPEAHKVTLKTASVIGTFFEFDLLLHSHPIQPDRATLLEQITMLEERDFLRLEPSPGLTYIFRHNITQEVTYETLLERQQRELHQAVGVVLEDQQPEAVERLAYHYRHSGVRDKALFYLDKAARKTQREYANETALNYYNQALALEEHWGRRQGQVEVLHILGEREAERAGLEQLEANPAAPVFEVTSLWGRYYEAIANYPEAQTVVERALAASREQGHIVNEARALAQLGLIAWQTGGYEQAKEWYHQTLASIKDKEHHTEEEAKVLIYALNGLGTTYRQQGEFDQAKSAYQQALSLSHQHSNLSGEAEALNSLGVTAYYQRELADALTYFQQALEIRQIIGDRTGEGKSLYSLSFAFRDKGDYGQAQECLSTALAICQATGSRWDEVNIWNELGILYQELGSLLKAEDCLQQGLWLAQKIEDEAGQAYILDNLGLVAYESRDFATAEEYFTGGMALARKHNDKHLISNFLCHMSMTSFRTNKFEEAIKQAETSLNLRQKLGMQLSTVDDLATLVATYQAIDDMSLALDYAHQVLNILEECGGEGPEFPQRDYFICYQVLAAVGQQEHAQAALQSAYNLVMGRAEKITDSTLRQSFLEQVTINREIVIEAARVLRVSPESE